MAHTTLYAAKVLLKTALLVMIDIAAVLQLWTIIQPNLDLAIEFILKDEQWALEVWAHKKL